MVTAGTSLLSFVMSNCEFVTLIGILGQVWMLDCVSIPDLPHFVTFSKSRYLVKPRLSKMCVRTNVPQKMFFSLFK